MTPQELAAAVLKAATSARCLDHWSTVNDPPCHPSDPEWNGCHLCVSPAGDAAAIRAAVELVLPEPPTRALFRPSEYELETKQDERLYVRDELLAIADDLEAPTDAS